MPVSRPTRLRHRPRAQDFGDFYRGHSNKLRRTVAANVHTADHTILDDACQHAWLQLARRSDITFDERGVQWLITVAIREGWHLARVHRDVPSGAFRGIGDDPQHEMPEPASLHGDPEALALSRVTHDQRAADLLKLKPVERRELYLHALGFTYEEIAEATGSTFSAVNRRINNGRTKLAARARLRELRGE